MLGLLGLLQPESLSLCQATADPCHLRRCSNAQRQVWLSLCGVSGSWCAQGFVWALWASLAGMEFDSKCNFTLLPFLGGFSFALWCGVSFFGGIQHSSVDGCSAASCNLEFSKQVYSLQINNRVSPVSWLWNLLWLLPGPTNQRCSPHSMVWCLRPGSELRMHF